MGPVMFVQDTYKPTIGYNKGEVGMRINALDTPFQDAIGNLANKRTTQNTPKFDMPPTSDGKLPCTETFRNASTSI